jgi:hypothetical protein
LFIHWLIDILSFSYFLATTNNVAVNICLQVFVWTYCYFCFVLFLVVLGFELRALPLKAGALPLDSHLWSFLLWLFWRSDLTFAQASLDCNPPILCFLKTLRRMHHHTQLFSVEVGLTNFFERAGLEL